MVSQGVGSSHKAVKMAEQHQHRLRQRRNFQPRRDIFDQYDNAEFKRRFRVDRAGIVFVTDLVRPAIANLTKRSCAVSAEMKVALLLQYLATGKMQQCNADDFGLSQPTISRVISDTLDALVHPDIILRFIHFPVNLQEVEGIKGEFAAIGELPNVVGVIDGTRIRITAPHEYEEVYVNRKNFHSINVQVLFDSRYKLRNMVAKWPGSTNDARILRESGLWQYCENGRIPPVLYPRRQWVSFQALAADPIPQATGRTPSSFQ
ncbi:putative nuclease HARBI1 [Portunus trituberculatus]|uniref:putative nuclease HARBI1 n=1 Tax=Portunus trituberculatus TaxID=210409 RepID=UPI001E1D196D|nr:putative nuclease HARBI1 [Portunus trituberculatus]